MRRLPYVLWAWLLPLAGCLEMEQTITIAKDGSGTQEVLLTVPTKTMAEIRRAATVNLTGTKVDPAALFTEEKVEKELVAAGLELVTHQTELLGAARKVSLVARFGSRAALERSPLAGSSAEWEFAPGPAKGTIEMTLYPQGKLAWGQARIKAAQMSGTVDQVLSDFFDKRRGQLDGLDLMLRFRLPGKVLRYTRNMEQTGENEVMARVTSEQIRTPRDLVRRLAPRFQVVFASQGCTFDIGR